MKCAQSFFVLGFLTACSGARTVSIDFVTRSSCGRSTADYDLSCVSSMEVRTVDENGTVLEHRCLSVANQYRTLADLVTPSSTQTLFSGLAARPSVRIEVLGYLGVDAPPCQGQSEKDLMFWGSSKAVDLDDTSVQAVPVEIECRPDCDCTAIDTTPAICPVALAAGICAPPTEVQCRKPCTDASVCYDGLLSCENDLCTPQPGGLCSDCNASGTCASGICAKNGQTTESFCAWRCPPEVGSTPCPAWMSCKRVGNVFSLLP